MSIKGGTSVSGNIFSRENNDQDSQDDSTIKSKLDKSIGKRLIFRIFTINTKHKILLNYLSVNLKLAMKKIIKCLRSKLLNIYLILFLGFVRKMKEKREVFLRKILNERNYSAYNLQKGLPILIYRRNVKKLISMNTDHFCIHSRIKNTKKLSLNVFLDDNSVRKLEFEFCKIRKIFVLYILRDLANDSVFRVHFICDDKVVIDPMYRTDYDKNGNFYNLIDFKKIVKTERSLAEDKERVVKWFLSFLKREKELEEAYFRITGGEVSSSDDEEEEDVKRNKHHAFSSLKLKSHRRSLDCSSRNFSNSFFTINKPLGRTKTLMNIISPKSILKSPSSTSRNGLGSKKVSFSNKVEFAF